MKSKEQIEKKLQEISDAKDDDRGDALHVSAIAETLEWVLDYPGAELDA